MMETLVTAAIIALVTSHIAMMVRHEVRHEKHDGEIFRLFDRLKMNRK